MHEPAATKHPLTTYREDRGLSRQGLAEALGVSRMAVWRWEEAGRPIEINLVARIAEHTGIPARELRPDLAELLSESESAA